MRFRHSQIKRSSAKFEQSPIVFGDALNSRLSGSDGEAPIWLPNTTRNFIRANQAAILNNMQGSDPGLIAATMDRDTQETLNSVLAQRPITVAERLGAGLGSGALLGSALQLAVKPGSSTRSRALLGLTGLGVGLGLSSLGPRHPLGKSAVTEWETDPNKPDVVQAIRPDRGLFGGALRDAVLGGIGGGTVAALSGVERLVPLGASIGVGAAGLAALNQALAARGDRIYSGRSKQSSAENIEPYDYNSEKSRALAQITGGGILAHLALGLGWLGSGISETNIENQRLNQRLLNPSRSLEEFDAARLLTRKLIDNSNRNWAIAAGVGAIPGLVMLGSGLHRAIKDERLRNQKTSSDNYSGLARKYAFSGRPLGPKANKSKQSSVSDPYLGMTKEEYQNYLHPDMTGYQNYRKAEQRNTAALGVLGALPGAAISGLGLNSLLNNLSGPLNAKTGLGLLGLVGGSIAATAPAKILQKADARRRREQGIDPGFMAPDMSAPSVALSAITGATALGTAASRLKNPLLTAGVAGLGGLAGVYALSKALKKDRERAEELANNDWSAYIKGYNFLTGNNS